MDPSDPPTPDTSIEVQDTSNRRRSGRARQKPVLLQEDPNVMPTTRGGSAKRKLADYRDRENGDEQDADSDSEGDSGESDPDEEELKEKRRKTAKKAAAKPAIKKPKTSNAIKATVLPVRPAVNGVKKSAKPRKATAPRTSAIVGDATGLYGRNLSNLIYVA